MIGPVDIDVWFNQEIVTCSVTQTLIHCKNSYEDNDRVIIMNYDNSWNPSVDYQCFDNRKSKVWKRRIATCKIFLKTILSFKCENGETISSEYSHVWKKSYKSLRINKDARAANALVNAFVSCLAVAKIEGLAKTYADLCKNIKVHGNNGFDASVSMSISIGRHTEYAYDYGTRIVISH